MEYIDLAMLRIKELEPQVPVWAKAEQMETKLPEIVLWKYSGRAVDGNK